MLPAYYAIPKMRAVSPYETRSSRLLRQVEDGEPDICLAYVTQFRPALNYTVLKRAHLPPAVPMDSPLVNSAVPVDGFPYPVLHGDA